MADPNEPKDETIRIDPQPQSVSKSPGPDTKSRETVRIQLGLRQPSDKLPFRIPTEPSPVAEPASQVLISAEVFPPPPLSTQSSPAAQAPVPGALSSGPKNETARIPRMPDLPSQPLRAVEMKKTQPLIAMPHVVPKRASIAMAPAEKSGMPLCWVLLGVSATILIIQIWTYFS
jgi:hypothetical protein